MTSKVSGNRSYEVDMCHGPLLSKILRFSLPLIATYLLQLLFNAADLTVIGHYAHYNSMAAIGATLNLNALVLSLFGGLTVGTNVIVARFLGENNREGVRRSVHTSMALSVYGGVVLMLVGLLVAKPMLVWMETPTEVLPLSCRYLWICFCGIPFIMIYNFGCSILRAIGDTRRPLIYLTIAGIVNVLLNLLFVILWKMDVAGVALATAISHGVAAGFILRTLLKSSDSCKLVLREMKSDSTMLRLILKIGIPAGLQSSCFALSNVLIQSSINSFGAVAMAGNIAAISMEGMIYSASLAFHQTAISFVSQNLGAKEYKRIPKCFYICGISCFAFCTFLGLAFYLNGKLLLSIFNPDPEVIAFGILRMKYTFICYGLCGFMDTVSGSMRGIGYSTTSMIVSLSGACVFRIVWILTVLPKHHTMGYLLLSYPLSWGLTAIIGSVLFVLMFNRILKKEHHSTPVWTNFRPGMIRGWRYLGGSK